MTRRAYLYFVLTFLLGVIVGGSSVYFYGWHSGRWHRPFNRGRVVRYLTRHLNLSDAQVQQLNQIMDESATKYKNLEKQVAPQFDALREDRRNRVRQILRPEQLTKFNELVRQRDERMKKQRSP